MARGTSIVKFLVAMTHNDEPIILDALTEDFDITILEGIFLEDEPFANADKIPKQVGLYEVECKYYWDDGCNFNFERTDGEIGFDILTVKELYKA